MNARPTLPNSAPFTAEQIGTLNTVMEATTTEQRSWLAGFLAGYGAALGQAPQAAQAAAPRVKTPLTILYATESGNSERLAMRARKSAQKLGFDAKILDMADLDLGNLAKIKNLLVIAATWGEGDPPERATDAYAALMGGDAPRLEGLRFAVLALGDRAYVNFCQTGRLIDERLEALGATRIGPRVECDLDYEKPAASFVEATLDALKPADEPDASKVVHVDFKGHAALDDDEPLYGATNPFAAEVTGLINLNGTGSSKETFHVELSLEPGFSYEPGDAIGIVAPNDPEAVGAVLTAVGLEGDGALAQTLAAGFEVTTLTRPVVERYGALTGREDVTALLDADAFAGFAADRQIVDFFEAFPEKLTAEQLTGLLRPLPTRLYSVASSPRAHEGEAHLLVGAVRWNAHGRARNGVASGHVADRVKVGDTLPIYVKPNRHFRLPKETERPIVMIGAGTGIAPFRAFVADRAEAGINSPSWLFFGDRNYIPDFLYQLEWQEHLEEGVLSRIDVAFSRDAPSKVYVQDRLWARRDELRGWIGDGAVVYVCGDEKGMGRDVNATLARILAEPEGGDKAAGEAKLSALRRESRYLRDVY